MKTSDQSTEAWALVIPADFARALIPLRLIDGLEIAEDAGSLWLRGGHCEDPLPTVLVALPARHRYAWLAGDLLRPHGSRLATACLPTVKWQPLRTWLSVTLPTPALPASAARKIPLTLVASTEPQEVNAITTAIGTWVRWAAQAPVVRLKNLRFAASTAGQVLVLGSPPPSLPCRAFVASEGLIVPAGWKWAPAVSAATIRHLLGAGEGTTVLWDEKGIQLLGEELFVAASRSAARVTAEELNHIRP